ncbi:MAG: hypothetical protein QM541_08270 [Flavobacterium sp.]|nr:hypothetical protein [Flavobacterium sp.]
MRRIKCFCLVFILSVTISQAQVVITAPSLPSGIVKTDMLWNVIVVNQDQQFDGILQLTINDKSNRTVFNASSSNLNIPKGAKTIFYNSVLPIFYSYNTIGTSNEWLKAGKYFICYSLTKLNKGESPIAQECLELNVEPLTPPLLNEPSDKGKIYEIRPNFSWLAPTPLQIFSDLKYEIKLVEQQKGQSASDALKNSSPIYFENGLTQVSKVLPSSYKALEVDHDYVWQVTAYDPNYSVKSEFWQFTVVRDSINDILEQTPYLSIGLRKSDIGIMHQGFVKIVLYNYTKDSIANLCLKEDGSDDKSCIENLIVPIKHGENYLVKQISTRLKLDEKKTYQIVWVNSLGEKFTLRYLPKYYK